MILGLSGPYAAGKGEVMAYLEQRSFYPLSLSDVIRDVLAERGEGETRERMIETGTELRTDHGPAVLAERLLAKMAPDRNYIVDSIRHPAEVEALRAGGSDFKLIWVDADPATRFARIQSRGRPGDPESLERLHELEGREQAGGGNAAGQQLAAIQALADFTVQNDGERETLHREIQAVLSRSLFFERPDWDEYFMSIARVVASRSNCVKRKIGAVITIDRRIVATGYNGTPRGVRNCNEGGCPRCNAFGESGQALNECICSHGEENAIVQSAYHGVSVRQGALYTTMSPCLQCTKMIVNSGITAVIYNGDYPLGEASLEILRESGVKLSKVELSGA
ncbi:MAG: AAA family ATPase [Deltaproteobacteria bacterium]|nr:AAA family ATPase [Deltaproteobacteria bacterium]